MRAFSIPGMPILPVVFSQYSFLDHSKRIFGQGHVNIQILEPIPTNEFANHKENLGELIEMTRSRMMEAQKSNREGNNNLKKD